MLSAIRPGVLARRDFFRLWAAQTVSEFGDQITRVALPLTAAVIIGASPLQMGLLYAAQSLPTLLFSLFAGVWIDRHRRRPVLVVADLGRALLLGWIPLAVVLGVLRFEQMVVVAFVVGVLEAFFFVAYLTYLPSLVAREDLVEANSRLQTSYSLSQIVGPAVGGVLVQLLTAGIAIAADAISFLFAGLLVGTIRHKEPSRAAAARRRIWTEMAEGMRALVDEPVLRALLVSAAIGLFFYGAIVATQIVYMTRDLGLDAVVIGTIFAVGSVSALLGAMAAVRPARAIGLGRSIIAATGLFTPGVLAIAAAGGAGILAIPLLVASQLLISFGATIYNVNGPSLRQALTPDHLLGRVNATYRTVAWGMVPLGALVGGAIGDAYGLPVVFFISAAGFVVMFLSVAASPLRGLVSVAPAAAAPRSA